MRRVLAVSAVAVACCAILAACGRDPQQQSGAVTTLSPYLCLNRQADTGAHCFSLETPDQLAGLRVGECVSVTYWPVDGSTLPRLAGVAPARPQHPDDCRVAPSTPTTLPPTA